MKRAWKFTKINSRTLIFDYRPSVLVISNIRLIENRGLNRFYLYGIKNIWWFFTAVEFYAKIRHLPFKCRHTKRETKNATEVDSNIAYLLFIIIRETLPVRAGRGVCTVERESTTPLHRALYRLPPVYAMILPDIFPDHVKTLQFPYTT